MHGRYYEVELLSGGLVQLGWATAAFTVDGEQGDGVGDTTTSWAYDGRLVGVRFLGF